MPSKRERKLISKNRSAHHEYFIDETFECGIELSGTEVKSIRERACQITDTFALIRGGSAGSSAYISTLIAMVACGIAIPTVGAVCCCTARRSTFLTANFATVVMRWFRWSSTLIPTAA